jgi:hypothetical protein
MSQNDAKVTAVIGSTGMGKGVLIKRQLLPARAGRRVLIWSPLEESDEYGALPGAVIVRSFKALYQAHDAKRQIIVFHPKAIKAEFESFCRAAFEDWRDSVIVVEELSDVTTATHASEAWRRISKQGRHRGLDVIAAMQRPAQVDKEFFGACTEVFCFRVGQVYPDDAKLMAKVMRTPEDEISGLPKLDFVHRSIETNNISRDSVAKLLAPSRSKPLRAKH